MTIGRVSFRWTRIALHSVYYGGKLPDPAFVHPCGRRTDKEGIS